MALYDMCSGTPSHAKHTGFDSRCTHNRRDWWLLLGDKDIGMEQLTQVTGLYN